MSNNKSVLVIDTPNACVNCPFHYTENYGLKQCRANDEILTEDIDNGKPEWCPLKELPEKYDPVSMNFEEGYNACIDDILEGKK